jgi:hypothetical protein
MARTGVPGTQHGALLGMRRGIRETAGASLCGELLEHEVPCRKLDCNPPAVV